MPSTRNIEIKRPTSWLGKLYDELALVSDEPISLLEELVQRILDDGRLNERQLISLQYRFPLPGFNLETQDDVRKRLNGVTYQRVGHYEKILYEKLSRYLHLKKGEEYISNLGKEELINLEISWLPWEKLYGRKGESARRDLVWGIQDHPLQGQKRPITVGDVLQFFNNIAVEDSYFPIISGYRAREFETTYNVFRAVGIELPEVKPNPYWAK